LQEARLYHGLGLNIVPLKARSKAPNLLEVRPYLSRCATKEELASWRDEGRFEGVGIVAGTTSGVVVVDADGDEGKASLKEYGHPPTWAAMTPNGMHLYFKHPDGELPTAIRFAPGLDFKASGYVVAPPSIGPTGRRYEWVMGPGEVDLADLPDTIMDKLRTRGRKAKVHDLGDEVPNGSRNDTLMRLAGGLRRQGLGEAAIYAALLGINTTACKPPLPESEVARIAESAARYERGERYRYPIYESNGNGHDAGPRERRLQSVSFAEMESPAPRRYVVAGLVPEAYPTVVYGDGGV
ncbi:MAG: hypothetical protein CYG60_12950, partial [Actinobacteria bacterium]